MTAPRLAVPRALDPALLAGWDRSARVVDLAGATMGTGWRVRLALPGGRAAEPVGAAVQRRLDGIEAQLSHWREDSDLARFNRAPAGSWTALPPDLAAVVAAALDVAARTDGAFDPAAGALTDLWGLGPVRRACPPEAAALAGALAASGHRRLAYDPAARRLRQPGGCRLDLSGIAKGHAADALADLLADIGLRHALVEVGGECAGRGLRPDGDPWWVELEAPAPPLRVALAGLAVATSGDYLRGGHTLDPRTGALAVHACAVSVLHASAMLADAYATALAALPLAEARALATAQGLAVRLVARAGEEWLSPPLLAMLDGRAAA